MIKQKVFRTTSDNMRCITTLAGLLVVMLPVVHGYHSTAVTDGYGATGPTGCNTHLPTNESVTDWQLVFRAVAGVSAPDPHDLWVSDKALNENNPDACELTDDFQGHYKSSIAMHWEALDIVEVRVSLYTAGTSVKELIFDGSGSTKTNWFDVLRLTSSPWTDLSSTTTGLQSFSVTGTYNGNVKRRFLIHETYGGCTTDDGWLSMTVETGICDWDKPAGIAYPFFVYADSASSVVWQSAGEDIAYADIFAIFIKVRNPDKINVSVWLVNGSSPSEGRVQVNHGGSWGTICDDGWDDREADVVCRQLGYPEWGNHRALSFAYFGQGSGPIWMDSVQCNGQESNIGRCSHHGWGTHDCSHMEDAGVICDTGYHTSEMPTNGQMTTISDPGEDSPLAQVVCVNNIMTAYIARSIIGDVTGDHLHFNDDTCVGSYHNSTHVRISTSYNQCGTVMEVIDDYVVFSNTVVDEALPITPINVISRERDMLIPVQCRIDRDGLGSISFHADTTKLVFREDGYGKFSFQLQLYQSASYVTPYPPNAYPIDVQFRDRLYFEAGVTAEPGLELFVETCVATSTASPYSSPQFRVIEDGCSNDHTLQYYRSSNPMLERFGLEAFAFVDKHTPVYVHCFLMICNISDPTSRCTQGCQPAIHKRDVSMHDEHSGSKSYVMTQGPLNFNQHSKEFDVTGSSSGADQWGFLVGSIAFVAMCIAATAMIIIKTRRNVSSGYHALATEEH